MKEAQEKRHIGDSDDIISKKRRIEQVEEANITKQSSFLENYLQPTFTLKTVEGEGLHGGYTTKVCGIRYPDSKLECELFISNNFLNLELSISGPKGIQTPADEFALDCLEITISCDAISLFWHRQDKVVRLEYPNGGKKVTVDLQLDDFIITRQNLNQWIEAIDPRLPYPALNLVDYFLIEKTEGLIQSYRNRTEDVLKIFCQSLPHEVFFVIWDFAISDGILSSKCICKIARMLDDILDDREQHWLKTVSLAVSKIVEQFSSSEMSYLFEECMMNAKWFKLVGQSAKEIYLSDQENSKRN